ncbi:MAG: hypothetical protein PUB68_03365 [Lachnospiraceae bacterium]|nr:hypothetical protein [Lachnospiraceae bacterium]
MKKEQKNNSGKLDVFVEWAHKSGRAFLLCFVLYMIIVPIVVCAVYKCFPSFKVLAPGLVTILLIMVPTGIAEVGSYTPILGSSSYLTFATGNLMNLKMPCLLNAQKIAKVEQSTPEGDAIALIATAVSSIVTIVVLAIGLIPALIVSALTIIGIASAGVASYLLIIMIPLTILCARILWKKGVIRVETVKEDK